MEPAGEKAVVDLRGEGGARTKGQSRRGRAESARFTACPIVLCESAIDELSCHALHPHYHGLSTAGARPDPAWLADLVARADLLYCGFDLDATGEAMAQAMIRLHPSIRRLRPSRKDWNDVLRLRP